MAQWVNLDGGARVNANQPVDDVIAGAADLAPAGKQRRNVLKLAALAALSPGLLLGCNDADWPLRGYHQTIADARSAILEECRSSQYQRPDWRRFPQRRCLANVLEGAGGTGARPCRRALRAAWGGRMGACGQQPVSPTADSALA